MIQDMERAIYKRDNIEAKGKVAGGKKGAPPTQAVLAKQVADLGKKLQSTTHDANLTQLNVLKLQESGAATGATKSFVAVSGYVMAIGIYCMVSFRRAHI